MRKGKISSLSYFCAHFLQIRTSPDKSMVERCFVDGRRLLIRFLGLSKPYFSSSWDSGLESLHNRIHFWVSNRGSDYKSYVRNNNLIMSCYTLQYLPYLPFFGDDQRSNSQKWHPSRLLNDDILAIIGSLKTLTVCFQPSRRCSIDLCNKNRGFEIFC